MDPDNRTDAELIDDHLCPVCNVLCGGLDSKKPRHALLTHLTRRRTDVQHDLWCKRWQSHYFFHGKRPRVPVAVSIERAEELIQKYYGKDKRIVEE